MQRIFLGLLAILLCATTSGMAQEKQPFLADWLPANTLVYLSVDVPAIAQGINSLDIAKLLQSPEWKEFMKSLNPKVKQKIEAGLEQFKQNVGLSVQEVYAFFQGEIGIALLNFEMGPSGPMPDLVISWDAGAKQPQFAEFLAKFRKLLVQSQQLEESTEQYKDTSIIVFGKEGLKLYLANKGHTMLLATKRKSLETIIDGAAKPLVKDEGYQRVQRKVMAGHGGAMFYLNIPAVSDLVKQLIGSEGQEFNGIMKMTGLDTMLHLALSMTFRKGAVTEVFYLDAPKRTGIFGAITTAELANRELLKDLPADAWYFSHGKVNIAGTVEEFINLLQKMDKYGYENFREGMAEFKDNTGVDFLEDILGNLTGDYLFYATFPPGGALLPSFVMELNVKDGAAFSKTLQKIYSVLPPHAVVPYEVQWQGCYFTYLNFSSKRHPVPLAPSFAIKHNKLYITLWPETIKHALTLKAESLHPAFRAAGSLANVKYTIAEFLDMKRALVLAYNTLIPFLQAAMPKKPHMFEPALLPSAQTVAKYMQNVRYFMLNDANGIMIEMHSPMGFLATTGLVGVVPALIVKQRMKHRRRAWRRHRWDK